MPFFSTDSTKIFYTTGGSPSNPAVVFIHGLGSSQNYFYSQFEALSSTHHVILLDTPGSGQSPTPAGPPSALLLVSEISALMDHLNVPSAIVVGHSLGGLLASLLAVEFPNKVAGLVLLGPVHPSDALAAAFETRVKTIEQTDFSLEAIYNAVPLAATGTLSRSKSSLVHGFIRELVSRQDPRGYIATCTVIATAPVPEFAKLDKKPPAIVLVGEEDKTAPYEGCVDKIATGLEAEVRFLEGVGHWHALEDPEAVLDAILSIKI
ncbi:Alpha/Beta hydrolase protein [Myxozyma melibiosi]|uniref:Alpha/Beta hydrolase protein n=1 Tax=Myxozyma melibiosi TaxID=54550 RepID=A0ABR1F702_9ASCO